MDIKPELRHYILDNYLFTDDEDQLQDGGSLIEDGIVDSTGILDLVGFIEETFEIQVPDTDLVPDNFDSVDKITAYIQRRLAAA